VKSDRGKSKGFPKIDESLGEVLCDRCGGSGFVGPGEKFDYSSSEPGIMPKRCKKCRGEGRLDWVENVVGKRPRSAFIRPGVYVREIDVSEFVPLPDVDTEIADRAVEQMAMDIDREIMEAFAVKKGDLGAN